MDIFMSMLVKAHQLKVEDGEVKLLGKNTAMVSLDVLTTLFHELHSMGKDDLLYDTAKSVVSAWTKDLLKRLPVPREKALDLSVRVLELSLIHI